LRLITQKTFGFLLTYSHTYYRIVGEASEKAPLLLLHGGPGSTHNYFEVLDRIAKGAVRLAETVQIGKGREKER
jgi:pimeloyl-ACP methyl ester carboxylesterase